MHYRRFAVTTLVLFVAALATQAQTSDAARRYFNQGVKDLAEGNLEVAFENYSRAIELSSRLDSPKKSGHGLVRTNNLDSADTDRISVVDPFTAVAYTNRGIVRNRQNDLDGAIADFNAALRINP